MDGRGKGENGEIQVAPGPLTRPQTSSTPFINVPGATVLNVNDDDANRYAVSRTLRRAGLRVEEADTGTEALRALARKPDLVILDVDLPDLNGFEICRKIKTDPALASIPVLQLSAKFVKSEDRVYGLEGGADGYLTQPFEPGELVATVKSLLRLRQAERKAEVAAHEWQATFEAISVGVCLTDREGRLLRCNQALLRVLGRTTEEALGKTYRDLLQGWSGLPLAELPTPEGMRTGVELCSKNRWFLVKADAITDSEGVATELVYTLTEVTDRKRAEAAEEAARRNAERAAQLEKELQGLERIGTAAPSSSSGVAAVPLSGSASSLFAELAGRLGELMELALEQRSYRVTHNLSAQTAALADRLSALRAGPRDVIELYNAALASKRPGATPLRLQAYLEEGRLLLLELMGGLVTHYRRHAPEAPAPAHRQGPATSSEESL